jgi:hypothetical protein
MSISLALVRRHHRVGQASRLATNQGETSMRFILMNPPDERSKAGAPPDPRLMARIGQLGAELVQKGVMKEMGGWSLNPVRLQLAGGEVRTLDGPYTEAKEVVGGYAIVEVDSQEEAVRLAREFLQAHLEVLGPSYELSTEIHRLYAPSDFLPPGAKA